jgi:hypothetical protein
MADRLLADATVAFHFAFIAFVVLGGLLVLRKPTSRGCTCRQSRGSCGSS